MLRLSFENYVQLGQLIEGLNNMFSAGLTQVYAPLADACDANQPPSQEQVQSLLDMVRSVHQASMLLNLLQGSILRDNPHFTGTPPAISGDMPTNFIM